MSASFVSAQTADVMVGGGTLLSASPFTASQNQPVVSERGGPYPSASFDMILYRRYGFNVEGTWKYKQGAYPGYGEGYRPILIDANALFQPHLGKKVGADFMVGVGAQTIQFNQSNISGCAYVSCANYLTSTHFMEHMGGGIRYYFWHAWPRVFIRPEVHYYHIQNNTQFNSGNVVRAGASLGFSFGGR